MAGVLDNLLTEYDDTLSSDSYVDPTGTLIIWSAFGRQVFRNRINSVSNDVRNYTLNLFHHYLVKKLVEDDNVSLNHELQRLYKDKSSLNFKQACLLLLENVFVFSILRHEASISGIQSAGILGISNARKRWMIDDQNPKLVFTHEPAGQILVRQLSLGVSGRYKTPLMETGFFDSNYHYHKPTFQSRWANAEKLITPGARSLLGKVANEAYQFLASRVSGMNRGGRLRFKDDIPSSLSKAYTHAFATPEIVGRYAKTFWLNQTQLNQGAAGALLSVLENSDNLLPQTVVERALKFDLPANELAKLEQIACIEPFLADCALLFTIMASRRTQTKNEFQNVWAKFGRDETRLAKAAVSVANFASLPAIKGTAAAGRR